MTRLDVYLHDDLVGRLERLQHSLLRFEYAEEWVRKGRPPLSQSLPVRYEPFDDSEARPYFAGLLPEGMFLRDIAKYYSVSAGNAFSLLRAIGGECAGAITLISPGEELPSATSPKWMSSLDIEEMIRSLGQKPLALLEETDGLRLSLAGAQEKLPVLFEGGQIGITRGSPPSTHIVKIPDSRFPGLVANEGYCIGIARELGLEVAEAQARSTSAFDHEPGVGEFLLVTRFDRQQLEDGRGWIRLHQEDFCQALGIVSEEKYEADGGPSLRDCARLLWDTSDLPARDLIDLVRAVLFNYIIGNNDAHGKNFSMLREGPGTPRLAPLYDLVSTVSFEGLARKMAMKIGGEYRPDYVKLRHWERFAEQVDLSVGIVRRQAKALVDSLDRARDEAKERIGPEFAKQEVIERIDAQISRRSTWLRTELQL